MEATVRKAILKGSIFFTIVLFLVFSITPIFILKMGQRIKLFQGLYENTGDVYDVVLLGSSHMNSSINPNVLWGEYGITSFNYGTGGQPIDVTYYLLKEVLKKQEKPIVVIDLYYLGLTYEFGQDAYVRYVLDNMKLSKNKVEAIVNTTPRGEWISYLLPIIKYHHRWKELKEEDFHFDTSKNYYEKGFGAEHEAYGKDFMGDISTKETAELPPKSAEYLYKIIDLSKKEGFKLVFTNAPHDYASTAGFDDWHKEPAKMFNKVAEIAKENGIPYINYNKKFDEIGFDFKSDMYNVGHMNIWGSNKVSTHFGKFLKENFDLADHRKDAKYARWNSDYVYYQQTEAATTLSMEKEMQKYIPLLKNKNYIIVMSGNNYNFSDNGNALERALGRLGLRFNKSNNRGDYIAVINNNKKQLELPGNSELAAEITLEKDIVLKVNTSSSEKNMPSIVLNEKEYANKYNGLNIAVYDKVLKRVIDSAYINENSIVKRN